MQQVTERLDRLISHIKEIQKPHMLGEKPVDIVLVRLSSLSSSAHILVSLVSPQLCSQRLRDENCRSHMVSSFAAL